VRSNFTIEKMRPTIGFAPASTVVFIYGGENRCLAIRPRRQSRSPRNLTLLGGFGGRLLPKSTLLYFQRVSDGSRTRPVSKNTGLLHRQAGVRTVYTTDTIKLVISTSMHLLGCTFPYILCLPNAGDSTIIQSLP